MGISGLFLTAAQAGGASRLPDPAQVSADFEINHAELSFKLGRVRLENKTATGLFCEGSFEPFVEITRISLAVERIIPDAPSAGPGAGRSPGPIRKRYSRAVHTSSGPNSDASFSIHVRIAAGETVYVPIELPQDIVETNEILTKLSYPNPSVGTWFTLNPERSNDGHWDLECTR